LHIQSLIDSLASIGDSISTSTHIDLILDGLTDDCRTICTILNNLRDPLSLDDVTSMLLDEESSIEKFRKKNLGSLNLVEGLNSNSAFEAQVHLTRGNTHSSSNYDYVYGNQGRGDGGCLYGRGGRGGARGRGHGRFADV